MEHEPLQLLQGEYGKLGHVFTNAAFKEGDSYAPLLENCTF